MARYMIIKRNGLILKLQLIILASLVAAGCTLKPTKVYETSGVDLGNIERGLRRPIEVTDKTIIVDARPQFEFAVAHLAGSVHLSWTEFADTRGPFPGRLKANLQNEVRKLARLGIHPESHVVVVGNGVKGQGEEARLAWTLLYLGIKNVEVSHIDALGLRYSNLNPPPPRENVSYWQSRLNSSVWATREEVIDAATGRFTDRVHIIDTRSKREYFSKNRKLEYEYPDLRAIQIEWSEFFDKNGRPNAAIRDQLKAVNVSPDDRVITICDTGLRSAAVAYAMVALGYKKAAVMAGGYPELLK